MAEPTSDIEANVRIIRELASKQSGTQAVGEFYDKWSAQYDQDVDDESYPPPVACAEALDKVVRDKSALIVDCGAGTGKVGQELAQRGFTRIDAVDISKKSLEIIASRGVYERLICDSLGSNKLKGVNDGYYSALISVGAVSLGHLPVEAFDEWTRIVKKGGVMVFTVRNDQEHKGYQLTIQDNFQKGIWELIEKSEIQYYWEHKADMYIIRRV